MYAKGAFLHALGALISSVQMRCLPANAGEHLIGREKERRYDVVIHHSCALCHSMFRAAGSCRYRLVASTEAWTRVGSTSLKIMASLASAKELA